MPEGRVPSVRHHSRVTTDDDKITFGVPRAVWTLAPAVEEEVLRYTGMLRGAERSLVTWHKEEENASRLHPEKTGQQ